MLQHSSFLDRCLLSMQNMVASFGKMAIIVNPSCDTKQLNKEQLKDIFLNPHRHSQFLIADLPSGPLKSYFYEHYIGKTAIQMQAHWQKTAADHSIELANDEDMIAWVAATPNAIGYVNAHTLDNRVKALII